MIMMVSCNSSGPPQGAETTDKQLEDSVAAYNQEIVGTESQEIEDYILRYQWQMKKTETGLRYMIYKQGDGRHNIHGFPDGPWIIPIQWITGKYSLVT